MADSRQPLGLDALLGRLYRGIAPAQRRLAALSLRAHVEKLVADGSLRWQAAADGSAQVALAPTP